MTNIHKLLMAEALVGYSANDIAERYFLGEFGSPDRWTYEGIIEAERCSETRHRLIQVGVTDNELIEMLNLFSGRVADLFAEKMEDLFS